MSYTFFRNSIPISGVEEQALWVLKNDALVLVDSDKHITNKLDSTVFYLVNTTDELCIMAEELQLDEYLTPLYHGRIEFTCTETGELLRRIEAYVEGQAFSEVKVTPSIELGLQTHFNELIEQFGGYFKEFADEASEIEMLKLSHPTYEVQMALKMDVRDDNPRSITRRSLYTNKETFAAIEKKLRQRAI